MSDVEERKGFLTPEQEKTLDGIIELKGFGERVDGVAIQLIDNQGLERLKKAIEEKHPGAKDLVYQVIDVIFSGIDEIIKK